MADNNGTFVVSNPMAAAQIRSAASVAPEPPAPVPAAAPPDATTIVTVVQVQNAAAVVPAPDADTKPADAAAAAAEASKPLGWWTRKRKIIAGLAAAAVVVLIVGLGAGLGLQGDDGPIGAEGPFQVSFNVSGQPWTPSYAINLRCILANVTRLKGSEVLLRSYTDEVTKVTTYTFADNPTFNTAPCEYNPYDNPPSDDERRRLQVQPAPQRVSTAVFVAMVPETQTRTAAFNVWQDAYLGSKLLPPVLNVAGRGEPLAPTPSRTPSASPSPTGTSSPTPSQTGTPSPSNSISMSETPTPTVSISATPSVSMSASPSNTPSQTPTPTISESPTASVTPSTTASRTPTPSVTPTPTPSSSPGPISYIVPISECKGVYDLYMSQGYMYISCRESNTVISEDSFDFSQPSVDILDEQFGLDVPLGLAIDGELNLYVADYNSSRVLRLDGTAATLEEVEYFEEPANANVTAVVPRPLTVEIDHDANEVITLFEDNSVHSILSDGNRTTWLAANDTVEFEDIAIDESTGTLYIVDKKHNRLLHVRRNDTQPQILPLTGVSLNAPAGVEIYATQPHLIFVSNAGSNQLLLCDTRGLKCSNFWSADISKPQGMYFDRTTTTLYVVQSGTNNIRAIDVPRHLSINA
jgi:hypothetical protein